MQPFFLDGRAGRLFALYRPPAPEAPHRGDVLVLPPFAEEMNRSRRMTTVAADHLARVGFGSLVFDLFGTGDSAGAFSDATVDIWRDDVRCAAAWLAACEPPSLAVLAVRFGALLATDAADVAPVARVVLWQPETAGQRTLARFLRVRVAATMVEGPAETTSGLRARLAAGETLEVAGYPLAPVLAHGLDALRLDAPAGMVPIDWFELVSTPGGAAPEPAAELAKTWRAGGRVVNLRTVAGPPFWTTAETAIVPSLAEATAGALA